MHFVDHLLEIKQGVKSSVVNGVRNPSTTGAEAVASAGWGSVVFCGYSQRSLRSLRSLRLRIVSHTEEGRFAEGARDGFSNLRHHPGWRQKAIKNEAKRPYLPQLLLDTYRVVNDNISPVVLPIRFPGTLVVAEVLNS